MPKTWLTCLTWQANAMMKMSGTIYVERDDKMVLSDNWRWRDNSCGTITFVRIDVSHKSRRAYIDIQFNEYSGVDDITRVYERIRLFATEHNSGCCSPFFFPADRDSETKGASFAVNSWGNKPATETGLELFKTLMKALNAIWTDAGLFYWPEPYDLALRSGYEDSCGIEYGWVKSALAEKYFSTPAREALLKRQLRS